MQIPLQHDIVYGPVNSRRLGLSLGLNILPCNYKVCPFNCVYCQYGFTELKGLKPDPNRCGLPDVDAVRKDLVAGIERNSNVSYITFSGNGEPTIHPAFDKMVLMLKNVRDKMIPDAKTAILSNSATVSNQKIRQALETLDCRFMKLDCGDEDTFCRFNRPDKSITFESLIKGLKSMRDIVIQALFAGGSHGNVSESSINNWINKINLIKPLECHIYSLDRPWPDNKLEKISTSDLKNIKTKAESRTGIPVKVF